MKQDNTRKLLAALGAIACISGGLLACSTLGNRTTSAASLGSPAISDLEREKLLAYDFSEGMHSFQRILVSDPKALQFTPQPLQGVLKEALTDADEEILAFYKLPNGQGVHWMDTVGSVMIAFGHSQHLPETGLDCYPELTTVKGSGAFWKMTPADRFAKYHGGVNFSTGRFHDSFTDKTWRPGALFFEGLPGSELRVGNAVVSLARIKRNPDSLAASYWLFGSIKDEHLLESVAASNRDSLVALSTMAN